MTQSSNTRSNQKQTTIPGLSELETTTLRKFSGSITDAEGSISDAGGSISDAEGSSSGAEGSSLKAERTVDQTDIGASPGNSCPKCGSMKVARSRPQGFDKLQVRLLPKRPYRCLRCYNRYWQGEDFFADNRRLWSWLVAILVVGALLWFSRGQPNQSVQAPPGQSVIDRSSDLSGSVDSTDRGTASKEGTLAESAQIEQRQRQAIEDLGFSVPAKEKVELGQPERGAAQPEELVNNEAMPETPQVSQAAERRADEQRAIARIEQESLLKVKIAYEVEQWRKAWTAGDSEAYLSHYYSGFVPAKKIPIDAWRRQRRTRVTPERNIRVELANFDVSISDDARSSTVTFDQRYQSNSYVDTMRKELIWIRQGQEWKIASELGVN